MITLRGRQRLEKNLADLRTELVRTFDERQKAAAEGDLKENSAYIFMGERANVLKTQIDEAEFELKNAKIATPPTQTTQVAFGHEITVLFISDNREFIFTLVGKNDTGLEKNWISDESPIGLAVLDKRIGNIIDVNGQPVKIIKIAVGKLD